MIGDSGSQFDLIISENFKKLQILAKTFRERNEHTRRKMNFNLIFKVKVLQEFYKLWYFQSKTLFWSLVFLK